MDARFFDGPWTTFGPLAHKQKQLTTTEGNKRTAILTAQSVDFVRRSAKAGVAEWQTQRTQNPPLATA
jgi:hypothetical protein